jgi:serine/threonine protein kinase
MSARPSDPLSLYDFVHFVYFAFDLGRLGAVFTAADEGVLRPILVLARNIFDLYDTERRRRLPLARVRRLARRCDARAVSDVLAFERALRVACGSGYTTVGLHGGYCTMPAFVALLLYEWRFESHVLLEVTMGSTWLQKGLLMPASESCADLLAQLTALYDVPGVSCEYENRLTGKRVPLTTDDDLAAAIKCADAPFVRLHLSTQHGGESVAMAAATRVRTTLTTILEVYRAANSVADADTETAANETLAHLSDELALALTLDTCRSLDTVRDVLAAVAGERARSGQQSSWSALPNVTPPESPLRSHAGTAPMPLARQHVRPMSEPELHEHHPAAQARSQSVSSTGSSSSAATLSKSAKKRLRQKQAQQRQRRGTDESESSSSTTTPAAPAVPGTPLFGPLFTEVTHVVDTDDADDDDDEASDGGADVARRALWRSDHSTTLSSSTTTILPPTMSAAALYASCTTVGQWLAQLQLSELEPLFVGEQISLDVVPKLTVDDLKDLNVKLGPRKKLLLAIEELAQSLKSSSSTVSNPNASSQSAEFEARTASESTGGVPSQYSAYWLEEELKVEQQRAASRAAQSRAVVAEAGESSEFPYREIDYAELRLNPKPIGRGAFGVVFKGEWRGAQVAVKKLMMYFDEKEVATFRAEAALMHAVNNHPHIVNFVGAVTRNGNFCLVTDFCKYGSVHDVMIKRQQQLPYPVVVKITRDAASGILHLHKERVIHRDIAARNFLLGQNYNLFVADFGLSRVKSESYGHTLCFDAADHQLLTSDGFAFLGDVLARVRWHVDAAGRVAVSDWRGLRVASYDAKRDALVYRTPRALGVNVGAQRMAEIGCARSDVSIVATENHELYVRASGASTYAKIRIDELLSRDDVDSVQLLTGARNGVVNATAASNPLLELYGYWLIDGGVRELRGGARAVTLSPTRRHDCAFVRERLERIGALSDGRCVTVAQCDSTVYEIVDAALIEAFAPTTTGDRWQWAGKLDASSLRHVAVGIVARCDGDGAVDVESATLRAQCERELLEAGFSVTVCGRRVSFRSVAATPPPSIQLRGSTPDVVRRYAANAVTWCFDTATSDAARDGFVVVRRAERASRERAAAQLAAVIKSSGNSALLGAALRALDASSGSDVVRASRATVCPNSTMGPVKYMAPEAISKKQYSEKSDAYSFGVFLWEIMHRQEPYAHTDTFQIASGVVAGAAYRAIDPTLTSCMRASRTICARCSSASRRAPACARRSTSAISRFRTTSIPICKTPIRTTT